MHRARGRQPSAASTACAPPSQRGGVKRHASAGKPAKQRAPPIGATGPGIATLALGSPPARPPRRHQRPGVRADCQPNVTDRWTHGVVCGTRHDRAARTNASDATSNGDACSLPDGCVGAQQAPHLCTRAGADMGASRQWGHRTVALENHCQRVALKDGVSYRRSLWGYRARFVPAGHQAHTDIEAPPDATAWQVPQHMLRRAPSAKRRKPRRQTCPHGPPTCKPSIHRREPRGRALPVVRLESRAAPKFSRIWPSKPHGRKSKTRSLS